MIYLAIDPGLTTGLAWYDTRTREVGVLEVRGRHELYRHLLSDWGFGEDPHEDVGPDVDVVVIERWDVRNDTRKKTNQDDPRYIIGAVEFACYYHSIEYREQRPVEAKRFATDAKLRELKWYSGGEGHADDAARHLLVALVKDRVPEILEAIA